jgi:choline dehydrogenase-like flavoprotein
VRGNLIANEILPGNDTAVKQFINDRLESALHPISTCQLGLCCDTDLRVYNVSNVRVGDASAFGEQVDANPSATIFALAEKLSDIIRKEYGYVSSSNNHELLGGERSRALAPGKTIPADTRHKLKDYSQIFPQAA